MYIILISIIFFIILFWLFGDHDFGAILGGIFLGSIIGLNIFLLNGEQFPQKLVLTETHKIYAMKDDNSLNGSFFLGCGGINNNMKYYYLQGNESIGGMEMKSINVESDESTQILIQESSKEQPKIITYQYGFVNKKDYHWGTPKISDVIKIIIPKNSIKYNYKVDME